jgi:hypothetical protein
MAALTTDQIAVLWSDGSSDHKAVLTFKNVNAGDTADLTPWFRFIKRVGMVSATNTHIAALTVTGGTTVTIPAGPTNDALLVVVVGVAV